jgi:drug/metabolite transporter (DMT)-like permease
VRNVLLHSRILVQGTERSSAVIGRAQTRIGAMNALWMVLASLLFASMGACVKFAGRHYGVTELLFYRALFGAVCLFAFVQARGLKLTTPLAGLHIRRSVVGTIAVGLWFYATTVLPLGTALTLNYTSPLFLAALVAGIALRSRGRIDWPLMATVAIGFIGVVLVLQPAYSPEQAFGAGAGLVSGVLSAVAYWHVKELGERREPEWRTVFYFSLTGAVLGMFGTLPFGFSKHTPTGALLLTAIGVFTLLAQLAMTRAYGRGRALATANLQYSAVVFASALGVLLFDDRIPLIGWTGIAVIMASGILSTALTARSAAHAERANQD